MKLFISQPMKDRTDKEILDERKEVTKIVKKEYGNDVEVIDSFIKNTEGKNSLWCLGESFKLLSQADAVYFTEDWDYYRGCRFEHFAAEQYGINIIHD